MGAAKELLRQERERFISVYNLVNLLVWKENLQLEEAAKIIVKILRENKDDNIPLLVEDVVGIEYADPIQAQRIINLLRAMAISNSFKADSVRKLYSGGRYNTHSDEYNTHGFDKAIIFDKFLKKGIDLSSIDAIPDATLDTAPDTIPAWANMLKAVNVFTGYEAACILSGIDPYDPHFHADKIRAGLLAISHNDLGLINIPSAEGDIDNEQNRSYKHSDLRAFAKKAGYKWIIPEINLSADNVLQSSDNSELLQQLSTLESENQRLESENQKLKRQLDLLEATDIEPEDRTDFVDAGFMAMRHAIKQLESGVRGKAKPLVLEYLKENYPHIADKPREAIALVFNFDKTTAPVTELGAIAKYLKKNNS